MTSRNSSNQQHSNSKSSTSTVYFIGAFFVMMIMSVSVQSQQRPQDELQLMLGKYPTEKAIIESMEANLDITMVNGKPFVIQQSQSSIFLLATNATNWADSREYIGGHMKLKTIEAYSLVPEKNKYRKIAVNNFNKTAQSDNGIFFDDQMAYLFTFPSVGQGTKLVSKTVEETDDCSWPYMIYFGRGIPTEKASVSVTCPSSVSICYKLYGYDTTQISMTITPLGNKTVYKWEALQLKAFVGDAMAPNVRYYTPHIQIAVASYQTNGKTIAVMGNINDLYRHSHNYLSSLTSLCAPSVKHLTDSITAGQLTESQKVRTIFYWVQKNIKYVAIEDGINGFVPREAYLVLQRRYGDCKDKTSLLVAMMRSQEIDASYAWLGSRDLPYRYSEFPTPYVDNHMVACWWKSDNEPTILDGTTHFHQMEDIPAFIQSKECMIEQGPDNHVLYTIPIAPASANMTTDSIFLTLKNDTLMGVGKALFTGEEKSNMMHQFSGRDVSKHKELVPLLLPKASNKVLIGETSITRTDNNDSSFGITYHFQLPNYLNTTGPNTYINLNIDRMFQNLNIKADRWLPIEVEYAMHKRFVCVLTLPEDKEIASLPASTKLNAPQFGFEQSYIRQGNQIILTTDVHFDTFLIEHEQIAKMRQMLMQLNQAYLQSIVLTKK